MFRIEWVAYDDHSGLKAVSWRLYDNYTGVDVLHGVEHTPVQNGQRVIHTLIYTYTHTYVHTHVHNTYIHTYVHVLFCFV